jgi:hypothetical protein
MIVAYKEKSNKKTKKRYLSGENKNKGTIAKIDKISMAEHI